MSESRPNLTQEEVDELLDALSAPESNAGGTGERSMSYLRACKTFGKGDVGRGKQTIFRLAELLEYERAEHPLFAIGPYQALGVIGAEYRKLVRAIEHGTQEESHAKALALIAQALRFILGEHRVRGWRKRD